MNPGTLPARIAQCIYCTEMEITFLGSPYTQLPFDIIIAFVQTWYCGDRSLEVFQISIVGPIWWCMNPGTLPARIAQCIYCAEMDITFLGSPYTQLPFDIIIALVQTRCRDDRQPRTFANFHCRHYTAVCEPVYFTRPYSPVRLLHRQDDYIFRFSIPSITF